MPFYKDDHNRLHYIESEAFAHFLPAGSVQITEAEAEALREAAQAPAHVPAVVSRFQARAAMLQAGILDDAEAAVAQADAITRLAWAEATEFRRSSPSVATLAATMGLSSAQLDDLFRAAAQIEA